MKTYMKKRPESKKLKQALSLYEDLILPRLIEKKMLKLLRQGKVSKWFSGIGQEAISIAISSVLDPEDYILPMHRNLGVFTSRGISFYDLLLQWQAFPEGFTKGRDRSFHFGSRPHHIVGMISHLGPQMGVACGISLGEKLRKTGRISAVFTGEGGTSEGDFHEALNIASVWDLPVVFCIENNQYALSTPSSQQYNCKDLADRAKGYGMKSYVLDGNNLVSLTKELHRIVKQMRKDSKPVLIEFKTFRVRGHEEASGTKYVPQDLIEKWKEKDPILQYENYLIKSLNCSSESLELIKSKVKKDIDKDYNRANSLQKKYANIDKELLEIYKPNSFKIKHSGTTKKELRVIDAIHLGLDQALEEDPELLIMGQDIADYGGVFKATDGFLEKYGAERIRNTPICESGIIEVAYGLSVLGIKSVVELQFADFVSSGFNPVVNLLAKSYYRWGQKASIVLRMPCGAGVGAGPFHSQTNESWFLSVPGLKVVYPAFPQDFKGLLSSSIKDENPVLFYEHKKLYRTVREDVSIEPFDIELGKARILSPGKHLTVVSYGLSVHWVLELLQEETYKHSIELIDLRTLCPLDLDSLIESVKKTGKALVVNEASEFMSLASEIAASLSEACFEFLDAPVGRLGSLDTPIPFAQELEDAYLANSRLREKIDSLLNY
ncbi:MAG: alpha-ketoacid dehydrogenase subunit alpha/beta [Flavobacteriaceae bacterium]